MHGVTWVGYIYGFYANYCACVIVLNQHSHASQCSCAFATLNLLNKHFKHGSGNSSAGILSSDASEVSNHSTIAPDAHPYTLQ